MNFKVGDKVEIVEDKQHPFESKDICTLKGKKGIVCDIKREYANERITVMFDITNPPTFLHEGEIEGNTKRNCRFFWDYQGKTSSFCADYRNLKKINYLQLEFDMEY